MNMNFKKTSTVILGLILSISVITPLALAAPKSENNASNKGAENSALNKGGANSFCERIANMDKFGQNLADREAKIAQKRQERQEKFTDRRNEQNTKRAEHRDRWNTNREEHFTKLMEMAGTDEQRQAMIQFQATVATAISTRRGIVDTAIGDFREGLANALDDKTANIETAMSQYKNAVQTAIDQAKADCAEEDADSIAIRDALKLAMKTAKDEFTANKNTATDMGDSLESLVSVRKQTMEQAKESFRTTIEAAKDALEIILGQPIPSPTVSPSPTASPSPTVSPSPTASPTAT